MALFSNKQESNLRSCVQMIESVIQALGHDPAKSRISTGSDADSHAWRVQKGSAFVTVSLRNEAGENQLQVSAPVMRMDGKVVRAKLYQRLLELNLTTIKGAAFALQGNDVLLVAERPTLDLDLSEVEDLLKKIETYADHYDDVLVAEFGGAVAGTLATK
jgi:hypothetical protein